MVVIRAAVYCDVQDSVVNGVVAAQSLNGRAESVIGIIIGIIAEYDEFWACADLHIGGQKFCGANRFG